MNVTERFLKYVSFHTTSDQASTTTPSTDNQKVLAAELVKEMKEMGIADAQMDQYGYVYGTIEATKGCEDKPYIGLISHMDTSDAISGKDVKARIVKNYDGKDIVLNEEKNIIMRTKEFSHMADYVGQDLIVTDGTTLLGADDKAGIAEILTLAEQLMNNKDIPHGRIRIGFTPDEEIGAGADHFDVERFNADFAYTVDGGKLGELEYENFNAAGAKVIVHGVNIHPGEAKNKMRNAILMGIEFNSMLPANEIPSCTEGYEGFQHISSISGNEEETMLEYIIRDHDKEKFNEKKATFEKVTAYLNDKYGEGTFELSLKDNYFNMKEKIVNHMEIVDRAEAAMKTVGVEPIIVPIRGGTDGARLSFMGLPCPNLSTGGHNFHGRYEYIPVQSMEKMVQILQEIIKA
ncbi:tripeptide aminopeptidase [Anaerosporobacter mobilis DSM 15930]|jgi:tripeptide aminopeptidase|uniref:Peptidase T n=1 Tax=Anaerosporobacter mobilis DSM 15930 TaxID=1120996 RepID=A0A1M7LF23_9FIRM|nr:peptidase T [Anaerosporobacter mobilis]SHM76565.1 tripeptide aminopeptidase [Anaerosporobacter mobilis DSM 15930]